MSLVNLTLHSFFNGAAHGEDRFARCALFIARRLEKAHAALTDIELVFEADEAQALARSFRRFADSDGSADGFAVLWNELEDWSGTTTYYNGREKTLYNLPHLPDDFAC